MSELEILSNQQNVEGYQALLIFISTHGQIMVPVLSTHGVALFTCHHLPMGLSDDTTICLMGILLLKLHINCFITPSSRQSLYISGASYLNSPLSVGAGPFQYLIHSHK